MDYYIGVDTGGTFTDVVVLDSTGAITFDKAYSTPDDPARGVAAAVANGAARLDMAVPALVAGTQRFSHGTTVGTNALIERKGTRVGLVCTEGFEDTLLIARGPLGRNLGVPLSQALDFVHNERPQPLVPRALVRGVPQRVTATGEIVAKLDEERAAAVLQELVEAGAQSIAVCLLWSLLDDGHEQRIREIAASVIPGVPVSLSSEVSPLLGEYERTLTTVVNAYVGPAIMRYVGRLDRELSGQGLLNSLEVLKCSGGLTLPRNIEREAAAVVNSGPVGGLVAAKYLGELLGYPDIVTSDMGGTSFDVGVVRGGEFEYEWKPALDQGVSVQTPAVKVVTVGAGGGSIAWTDGERLMVGPHSAGADPGPACYGKGEDPTVTDVLVVLGILGPDNFFGGRKKLDADRAAAAVRARVAEPLSMTVTAAAEGIYEIVTARMGDLIRKVTVESGYDPRRFALLAYGGASPAHAALYARDLGMRDVVVPYTSSVFSALGCALSDVKYSYARSEPMVVQDSADFRERFNATFEQLEDSARADVSTAAEALDQTTFQRSLDLRYATQLSELNIPWGDEPLGQDATARIRTAFERAYEDKYGPGTTRAESPLEIISFRLDSIRPTAKPPMKKHRASGPDASPALKGTREVSLRATGPLRYGIYDGALLEPGNLITGPAVIERADTTILVPVNHEARLDEYRNTRIRNLEMNHGA